MKEFKVLRILDCFRKVFEKFGVDYNVMRRILQIKFTMDGRRIPTIISNNRKKEPNPDSNNFLKSLWFYAFLGIILVPIIIMGDNFIFQMSIVQGIIMFLIMSSLISDFSAVLLDIRDKNILFTKPVNQQTIHMAKSIHIFTYMFYLTISFTGPALVASLIRHGFVFFIIFLVEIILIDLFVVVIAAMLYLAILRFFDGEKLKDVINYFQIGLTITITVGYQLVGRLFNVIDLNVVFQTKWWQYFIIPVWFGGPFEIILKKDYRIHFIVFSLLAMLVPAISIIIYIRLIPLFERNLQKLNNNSTKANASGALVIGKIAKIICRDKDERTFFKFASSMMKNEREFKLKVYPSIGMALVFPFIFILNRMGLDAGEEIKSSRSYFNIYWSALLLPTVVMMLKYSGRYQGAWIYKVLPIRSFSFVQKGTLKAIIVRFILPIYSIESIIFIAIFGVRILPDLVIVFLNILLFVIFSFSIIKKGLPFSEPFGIANQSEGLIVIPLMMVLTVIAAIHFGCTFIPFGRLIMGVVVLSINLFVWRIAFLKLKKKEEVLYDYKVQ